MTTTYPVLKGVPIPPIRRGRPRRKYDLEHLAVGDMQFVPGRTVKQVSAYVSKMARTMPAMKFTTRVVFARRLGQRWEVCEPTDRGATEGVGVWRVE